MSEMALAELAAFRRSLLRTIRDNETRRPKTMREIAIWHEGRQNARIGAPSASHVQNAASASAKRQTAAVDRCDRSKQKTTGGAEDT